MGRHSDHPRDEWIEVTAMGEAVPRFILAVDGREVDIAKARALFLARRIDVDEFERRVGLALVAPAPEGEK